MKILLKCLCLGCKNERPAGYAYCEAHELEYNKRRSTPALEQGSKRSKEHET
jgi:hypothetical protein